jgi:hypothetical protein
MSSKLEWNGDGAKALVRRRTAAYLLKLLRLIVRRAKELLSVPGTGKTKGKKTGPVVHASAGDPPHKQTGRGRASVTYEFDDEQLVGRAGTNVEYMKHQELGTRKGLAPHPWLRPAYEWAKNQVGSLEDFLSSSDSGSES